MNKVFKIVFNAARGTRMVVNETTSSVQSGKKAAVTVAVVGALASSVAMAGIVADTEVLTSTSELVAESSIEGTNKYVGIRADGSSADNDIVVNVAKGQLLTVTTDGASIDGHTRLFGAGTKAGNSLTVNGDTKFVVNATGDGQARVFRVNGGKQSFDGKTVATATTVNGDLYGFSTWENSETTVTGELLDVTLTSKNANYVAGVYNFNGSTMNVEADVVKFNVTNEAGDQAVGIRGNASATNITADDLDVVVKGGQSQTVGVFMSTDKGTRPITEINLTSDDMLIEVDGNYATAVVTSGADGYLNLLGEKATITANSASAQATGFQVQYHGVLSVENDVTLNVKAKEGAYGVSISEGEAYVGGGSATFNGALSATVNSSEVDAFGVFNKISEKDSTGVIKFDEDINVTTTADKGTAYGILSDGKGSSVVATGNVTLITSGVNATGARVVSSDVTLGGEEKVVTVKSTATTGNAYGIQLRNDYKNPSQVIVEGSELNVSATTGESGSAMGLVVQGMSTNGKEPLSTLVVKSDTATIMASDIGVWASGDAYAAFNGASRIEIAAPVAIEARDYAKVMVNEKGTADVAIKGDVDFSMQYGGKNSALVNLNLNTPESSWEGNVKLAWIKNSASSVDQFKQATLKINLANGAQWTPTKVEDAGTIGSTEEGVLATAVRTMTMDGGVVNVNAGIKAQLDTLSGSGTVNLNADVAKVDDAGYFIAANAADTTLDVNLTGVTADDNVDVEALMDHIQAEGATVKGYVQEGQVQGAIVVDADGEVVEQAVNSKTEALADKVWLAPNMITRIMMNDVRKRMGDLRAAEGTHGVWARYNGGQMSGTGVDADFSMVQVGIDTVPVADAPRFGVAFSYAETEAKDNLGTTDMDSFSLAFYGTKMYDNGMFVDVIGRMATMDSDIVNAGAKGKMDNVALSLSGELGWRFDVTDRFFFEPSVEATYTYTNADTFTMTNGGKYELEAMDSLVGRAGFAAGFKCPANKGDVYVRAAVVHEFMGDATINSWTANGAATPIESDGKDTWFEYAIGAQFNVNKNTYVYADIERTEGATMDEDWRANVGVRFAF